MTWLAGDIGGTKSHLALIVKNGGEFVIAREKKFPSQDYLDLHVLIKEFLQEQSGNISKACFGIAGPIKEGVSQITNLPWLISSKELKKTFCIEQVALINDLEANAYGLSLLQKKDLCSVNEGASHSKGNQAIISPGTGLGEAGLFFNGKHHLPFACEGGHTDFAPQSDDEDLLLRFLRQKYNNHISYERVLSGPGLCAIYQFIVHEGKEKENPSLFREIFSGNASQTISEMGMKGLSKACERALNLFVSILGAEAGNLALKIFATGGIFLGGGISPKILKKIKSEIFLSSFTKKGRFAKLLRDIPIWVVLNDKASLFGAIYYATRVM